MTQDDAVNDPSTTSISYDVMLPRWTKIDTVLSGTDAMRRAAGNFLPQHEKESNKAYTERLNKTVLYNATEFTLNSLVGKAFSEPLKISEDMPENVESILDNINMQGDNIDVFARNWFKEGFGKGLCHVLIDFPRVVKEDEKGNKVIRTLADDRAEKLRPYWVMVKPENVIFAHAEIVDGREVLTHLRIKEYLKERVGFTEIVKERIRVIEPGIVNIYEKKKSKKKKEEWVLEDTYTYDLDFIPFVTFYSEREDFMESKPPLTDLVDLNISHWQSSSDQDTILTISRFPMLAVSGADVGDDGKTVVGPHQMLSTSDPQGKFYYVEHSGKAIAAGRQHLLDLEEKMAEYGTDFLKRRPGNNTATARAIDSVETTAPLQDMVIRFTDAINQALEYTKEWLKIDSIGTITMDLDFALSEATSNDLDALKSARQSRDISRKTYLGELQRIGVLHRDFDIEEDEENLEQENAINGESEIDIDPAAQE